MPRLMIDLQGGFDGGDVRIEIDGELVAELSDVRSDLMTGSATSIETDVTAGPHLIEVTGAGPPIRGEVTVHGETWVGVDAIDEVISASTEPFGYS